MLSLLRNEGLLCGSLCVVNLARALTFTTLKLQVLILYFVEGLRSLN